MNAQSVIGDGRIERIREMRAALSKAAAENQALKAENDSLKAHFDLALVAAHDFEALPPNGKLVIVDGWNLVLGSPRLAANREELERQIGRESGEKPDFRFWIVYDGPRASSRNLGNVRITYTGGTGEHRADRFICDFLRMARWLGQRERVEVRTRDADFLRDVAKI